MKEINFLIFLFIIFLPIKSLKSEIIILSECDDKQDGFLKNEYILNLNEFIAAMSALGFSTSEDGNWDALRTYFHSADENDDGVLEIDEFLRGVEELDFD